MGETNHHDHPTCESNIIQGGSTRGRRGGEGEGKGEGKGEGEGEGIVCALDTIPQYLGNKRSKSMEALVQICCRLLLQLPSRFNTCRQSVNLLVGLLIHLHDLLVCCCTELSYLLVCCCGELSQLLVCSLAELGYSVVRLLIVLSNKSFYIKSKKIIEDIYKWI